MVGQKIYTDKESHRLRCQSKAVMERCTKYLSQHLQGLSGAELSNALDTVKAAEQRIYKEIGFKDPWLVK